MTAEVTTTAAYPTMDVSCVANVFRQLPSRTSRAAALHALFNELDPYEWRDALAGLGSRTFQFDIVGSLPAEIVIMIFSFLDIATSFRLQRVRLSFAFT
jgi:hypothetical protein